MRRVGLGKDGVSIDSGPNTTESSIVPSKAGSETGDDSQRGTDVASPTDSTAAKDKAAMTREEREAKYRETRERIFKGFEDAEQVDIVTANDASNDVSRASSVNEKKRTRKQRNNDDGFEARSKFNAYYPAVQYSTTTYDQTANPAYYNPYGLQPTNSMNQAGPVSPAMLPPNYVQGFQPVPNASSFTMAMHSAPAMNGSSFNGQNHSGPTFPLYNSQMQPSYYQPMQQQMGMGQNSPGTSSPVLSNATHFSRPQVQVPDQSWPPSSFPYPLQRPREQQQFGHLPVPDQGSSAAMHPMPYQYGQLPYQGKVQGGRAQHPLPGSYNRPSFNPQTRAFVPGAGVGSQSASYGNTVSEPLKRASSTPVSNSKEIVSYPQVSGSFPQAPLTSMPNSFNQTVDPKPYGTRKNQPQSNVPRSPGQSSLSKWGTPAHLPPKPPPPETPNLPEAQHSLPVSVHAPMNIQPVSNGQPMPTFQNGVYSMPALGNQ